MERSLLIAFLSGAVCAREGVPTQNDLLIKIDNILLTHNQLSLQENEKSVLDDLFSQAWFGYIISGGNRKTIRAQMNKR